MKVIKDLTPYLDFLESRLSNRMGYVVLTYPHFRRVPFTTDGLMRSAKHVRKLVRHLYQIRYGSKYDKRLRRHGSDMAVVAIPERHGDATIHWNLYVSVEHGPLPFDDIRQVWCKRVLKLDGVQPDLCKCQAVTPGTKRYVLEYAFKRKDRWFHEDMVGEFLTTDLIFRHTPSVTSERPALQKSVMDWANLPFQAPTP